MQAGVPVWADSYIIHRLELKVVHNTILPAWGHGNGIVLDVTDRVTHCGQQPCHGPKLHRGEGGWRRVQSTWHPSSGIMASWR